MRRVDTGDDEHERDFLSKTDLMELAFYDHLSEDAILRLDEGAKARFRNLILGFMAI